MGTLNVLMLATFASFSIFHLALSQNQQGFISLDCGLPSNESPYNEPLTNLTYISDVDFVHGGKSGNIQKDLETGIMKPYRSLRYFPDGARNCYSLDVRQDTKYLIRTFFIYGNYDGLTASRFDLYLGPNFWTTIDVQTPRIGTSEKIIHITRSNKLDICLVKTGTSNPFISAIELRPVPYDTYAPKAGSLRIMATLYFTNSSDGIRYPEDVFDRIWDPYFKPEWTQINTTLKVNVSEISKGYEPPQGVITTAAIPKNASEPFTFTWNHENSEDDMYAYIYFADIQQVNANQTREFKIMSNGVEYGSYIPPKFEVRILINPAPIKCAGGVCRVQLIRTPKSTLPPLMNAMEIFSVKHFPQSETSTDDVTAIKNIQSTYKLSKISWQGDPCVPKQFSWTGLSCNFIDTSTPPRIITLDLSSSGLSGVIPPSIQNLTQLRELDLSKNNLTGDIPEFLAQMKSLLVINLSGNNLRGYIPQALLDREKDGLKLSVDANIKQPRSRFPVVMVVVTLSCVAIIIIVLVLIFIFIKRKTSTRVTRPSLEMKNRRFTYTEVKEMTNNFQVVLGKGGFGVVCHGSLNNEQVAVKVLSQSSTQGYKEFKTEVELLLRVHHVNLVSLIGYCDEGNDLALIYEFMKNGNLREHLSGKFGGAALSWSSRLKIAIETALGIEYLHIGCKPPMVHRDVKSTNILIGKNFEAKLADFGLSRSFVLESQTHVSNTDVAGTLGYLDPEYYQKNWLTEKSDVYSFGIVLLELISGQRVIEQSREKSNIAEWAKSMLVNGDIESIMDPNLHQEYDTSSSWKALELAMSCIKPSSTERPNMTRVAHELNECLEIYENLIKRKENSTGLSISFISETPLPR